MACGVLTLQLLVLLFETPSGQVVSTFKAQHQAKLNTTYRSATASTRIQCCQICSNDVICASVSYSATSNECLLSTTYKVEIPVESVYESEWSTHGKFTDRWFLAYRATAGIGGARPYKGFVLGTDTNSTDVICQDVYSTACNYHYRNTILDNWNVLDVEKAKFALYKDAVEVAYVIFDAKGANITNWFAMDRVVDSSWIDITDYNTTVFSIKGVPRDFSINVVKGCNSGKSFQQGVWKDRASGCNQDYQVSYPQFLYSNTTTYGLPHHWQGTLQCPANNERGLG